VLQSPERLTFLAPLSQISRAPAVFMLRRVTTVNQVARGTVLNVAGASDAYGPRTVSQLMLVPVVFIPSHGALGSSVAHCWQTADSEWLLCRYIAWP
jgi:hypothetical protein